MGWSAGDETQVGAYTESAEEIQMHVHTGTRTHLPRGEMRISWAWSRKTLRTDMTTDHTCATEHLVGSLMDMAVESWRFSRLFARLVSRLDAGEGTRYVNQLRYFQKKVEETLEASGMKIVNVEGHPFDLGMAASAINIGDFGPDDVLVIDQMVEPIIMGPEGLRRQGTVTLRKVQA